MCNATHLKRAAQTLSQALAEVEFMQGGRGLGQGWGVGMGCKWKGGGLGRVFGRRKVNSSQG